MQSKRKEVFIFCSARLTDSSAVGSQTMIAHMKVELKPNLEESL